MVGEGPPRRWRKERLDRFFREDVRDLEPIRDLSTFQLLADLLPERVCVRISPTALSPSTNANNVFVSRIMIDSPG